jgi:hypothetical protein
MLRALTHIALTPAALLAVALCACTKARTPDATEADCAAYREKMFSLLPEDQQKNMAGLGMDKPTPKEIALCRERMNSDEVACALKATTLDDALACKSATDDRPDEVRRTPEECKAYSEHMLKLAEATEAGETHGPPLTPAMAKMAGRECERWLTKKRYDCVMKAEAPMGLMNCPP